MASILATPQLKNRIFGAILLLILAVLLIPLFLGEPRSDIRVVSQPQSSDGFQSKIQPLSVEDNAQLIEDDSQEPVIIANEDVVIESQTQPQSNLVPSEEDQNEQGLVLQTIDSIGAEASTNQAPVVEQKQVQAEVSEPKTEEAKPVQVTAIEEGWALQAGIFSKKENAKSITDILIKHNFKPNSDETEASFGTATRVWLGPYKEKSEAQAVSAKLETIIGSGGYVAVYPFK